MGCAPVAISLAALAPSKVKTCETGRAGVIHLYKDTFKACCFNLPGHTISTAVIILPLFHLCFTYRCPVKVHGLRYIMICCMCRSIWIFLFIFSLILMGRFSTLFFMYKRSAEVSSVEQHCKCPGQVLLKKESCVHSSRHWIC